MRPAAPAPGNVAMFDKRTDLVRFLAVADTGRSPRPPNASPSPSRR